MSKVSTSMALLLQRSWAHTRLQQLALCCVLASSMPLAAQQLDGATGADWPGYGGTAAAWRHSALDQINTDNVDKLQSVWSFHTGDDGDGLTATPIVIDGLMYISTPTNQVFALDARTGDPLWHYTYTPRPNHVKPGSQGSFVQNRGVAVHGDKVFMGTIDSQLVALDRSTGHEVWRVAVDDSRQCGCNILSAPLIVKDMVVVGQAGGDGAFRGYLSAFDTATGRMRWRRYVIPGPGEPGHDSWKGDSWRYGGGAPWLTGSYDAELDLIYWGTGNAAGDFYAGDRVPEGRRDEDGVNLHTASILALKADSGEIAWAFQEVPRDMWDFDAAYEVILFDREIDGVPRRLLAHMNKGGIVFVLDRTNGAYIGSFTAPEVQTWFERVDDKGLIIGRNDTALGKTINTCPTAIGAKSWNQMAYSPDTGLLYAPVLEFCGDITATDQEAVEGVFYASGSWQRNLPQGRTQFAHLDAWDPLSGERVWSVPFPHALMASVLSTAGNLVFTGDPAGYFMAFDARTGEELWRYQTGAGHRGSAVSYAIDGKQYIATPVGFQGSITGGMVEALFPDQAWRSASALTVFALPE